jgi:hypothetical protein
MTNKALDLFYRDALRLGNIKVSTTVHDSAQQGRRAGMLTPSVFAQCFTHFQPYIKGREELVLTIYTNGADPQEKPRIWQMLTKG